jgi:hypothetical protein
MRDEGAFCLRRKRAAIPHVALRPDSNRLAQGSLSLAKESGSDGAHLRILSLWAIIEGT